MRMVTTTKLCVYTLMIGLFIGGVILSQHMLSEQQALTLLFGDYDTIKKQAIWKNIPFDSQNDVGGLWEKRTGVVSTVLLHPYQENHKQKIFLLTKTLSTDVPYDCHACAPLLSAFVFSRNHFWNH